MHRHAQRRAHHLAKDFLCVFPGLWAMSCLFRTAGRIGFEYTRQQSIHLPVRGLCILSHDQFPIFHRNCGVRWLWDLPFPIDSAYSRIEVKTLQKQSTSDMLRHIMEVGLGLGDIASGSCNAWRHLAWICSWLYSLWSLWLWWLSRC